jgi:hypothetical protein
MKHTIQLLGYHHLWKPPFGGIHQKPVTLGDLEYQGVDSPYIEHHETGISSTNI